MASLVKTPLPDRTHDGAGGFEMTNRRAAKLALWLIPVALAAWAIVEAYSAYLNRWGGSLRAPLIAGSLAGIAFVVVGTAVATWQDRASEDAPTTRQSRVLRKN
jgi:hypothetical protein